MRVPLDQRLSHDERWTKQASLSLRARRGSKTVSAHGSELEGTLGEAKGGEGVWENQRSAPCLNAQTQVRKDDALVTSCIECLSRIEEPSSKDTEGAKQAISGKRELEGWLASWRIKPSRASRGFFVRARAVEEEKQDEREQCHDPYVEEGWKASERISRIRG